MSRHIRRQVLDMTTAAGSGHPTSCLSAVELLTALFFGGHFRADLRHPQLPTNDRFLLSKGHAAPLLYALYAAAGAVPERELRRLRQFGSRLEGHPMPSFPYAEFPTGSLGQGLSVGVGIALAARLQRLSYRTYVLLGDSELAEGSVWEAAQLAAHHRLGSLTAIIDANRLGQSGPTMLGHRVDLHARRMAAFGWRTIVVDGHDLAAIQRAYAEAGRASNRPTAIIAKTIKGRGVSFLENRNGWHGRTLTREQLRVALRELGPVDRRLTGTVRPPRSRTVTLPPTRPVPSSRYPLGTLIAPRRAFGNALVRLAPKYPRLIVLDGEVKNSTHTEEFAQRYPRRFIEGYVAEQNLVGMAAGLASRGQLPVTATFAAFLTRAFDQLRMAQYAGTHQVFVGTHVGVHIGPDGPSQMGLEDLAMFRTLHGTTVLYPADAVGMEKLFELALRTQGLVYLRATRHPLPVLYRPSTPFAVGGSHVLRASRRDRATIVGAGVTLHEALRAAEELAKRRINVRVIDLYSIQPVDAATLRRTARQTKRLIVVEDHVQAGGLSEAVRSALGPLAGTVVSLAVRNIPHSGTPEQLLAYEGLNAAAIVRTVRHLLAQ